MTIEITWTDRYGDHTVLADSVRLWQSEGGADHVAGTVVEAYRSGSGVLQLDQNNRIGAVYLKEVRSP